jgi:predicted lactoylglutathione lyase
VNVIRSREFFTGIGYKIKFDVSDETVNQAATKFLKTPEPPPAAN